MKPASLLTAFSPLEELFDNLLAVSLTGVIFYMPLYNAAGELVDFTFEYLNPAAQRMMRMPERPTLTHNEQWPHSKQHGTFDFHVEAFVTGEPREYNINYQADGYDNFYRLAARRSGAGLLVSFTDTADQPRTAVEVALRESQVAEQTARAQVERQRQQLQQVFYQAPVAIAVLDGPEYRISLANPSVCQIWGRPEEQLLGVPLLEALPELQGQGVSELLNGVLYSGEPFIGTELPFRMFRYGRLDTIYFNFVYQPQQNEQGVTTGVLVVATDVTDQVVARQQVQQLNQELEARVQERTQAALALQADLLAATQRQAQERETFYQVFEQTPALIALLRAPSHRYEYVNPTYQAFFPDRPLLGLNLAVAAPELVEQGFGKLIDHVYQTGETYFGQELPFAPPPKEGELPRARYFNFTYQAYREKGEIAGVSIFAFDVTEQVLARQAREEERQQLQAVFTQAPVAVCVFQGQDYTLDLVNPPMCEMLGQPYPALIGQPFFDALPELRSQGLAELLATVRRTAIPYVAQEQEIQLARHQPGAPGYFNFVYQPLLTADDHVMGIVCVATDVTEQVLARRQVQDLNQELAAINEELQATNEELGESNQQLTRINVDLDNFIYTASHDLREPITNLEGLIEALQEELPASSFQVPLVSSLLTMIHEAVARFQLTIAQLTDLAQLQQAQLQPPEAVDVAALVESIRLDLAPRLAAADALLSVAITTGLAISFAPKHLRSILYNLLSNAVKYRDPARRPVIALRCFRVADKVLLEVQDNGLGLDATQQTKLFGLFQRLHHDVEGSGIGLYMVKRIVDNVGGSITVRSQPGVGTVFSVYLSN
ncbi:PAS domain-containing protein [Hymenobacter cellulosilyticus]|uniref:histidine kinase n=1 Tax=Hymenobacter cellulosilyticus TaxID=2932248 RepID=A0A8T9QDA0_9BACT|nr:PAS domain-containing protein [Hymenobacter cellulosilyticus]UOQ74892.1 PAS domain-containing protein [Hymenobacter cellulosilyticus]